MTITEGQCHTIEKAISSGSTARTTIPTAQLRSSITNGWDLLKSSRSSLMWLSNYIFHPENEVSIPSSLSPSSDSTPQTTSQNTLKPPTHNLQSLMGMKNLKLN